MSKLIIVIIIAIIVGAIYFEKRRGSGLEKIATSLGFDFVPGQHSLPKELEQISFDLFTQGPANINNRMTGHKDAHEISIFDFTYTATASGEGDNRMPVADDQFDMESRSQSVIWVRLKKTLPEFDLSPRRIHKRTVAARFNLGQVTFDGQSAFNQQFSLLGRDGEKLRQLFSQKLIDQLASLPNLVIESRGHDLLFYRFEERPDPKSIPGFLQEVEGLLALL